MGVRKINQRTGEYDGGDEDRDSRVEGEYS